MPAAFSFNREFDFVRLDGLRRATGRPAHEWDLYIVKELVDNALDADETLWQADPAQHPSIRVDMEYISLPGVDQQQLSIRVGNRATFPAGQIADIFATQRYTSSKAFIKGLTRGALGNALKTLLGIPYALRNRLAGDWEPDLKPLSIRCGATEYLPRYAVDTAAQHIEFTCEQRADKPVAGTLIRVALDHFGQEVPRTLADIALLARQYHVCNPHARFHWAVDLAGAEWSTEYAADQGWADKLRETAPLWWYSPTAFQDLLGALYRKHCGEDRAGELPIELVCRCFAGFESRPPIAAVIESFGQDALAMEELEGPTATDLYQAIGRLSPRVDSNRLGRIGQAHLGAAMAGALPLDGDVIYACSASDDPEVPFVIEAAVAHLVDGKRQIWTAINFSPSYDDPFLSRRLRAPIRPDEPALGLRGLLDAYGMTEGVPLVLFLHLICPNIEHHEFSKTEINHLPFKQALGEVLDQALAALRQARDDEERRLEQTVFRALDAILGQLSEGEQFIFEQLLERLHTRLAEDPALAAWLERPDTPTRLRLYIGNYQAHSPALVQHVARPPAGTLSIPLHPQRHLDLRAEHVTRELLAHYYVNKLLYVQLRELETVVIENGWLCRMDLGLLHNPPAPGGLQELVARCIAATDLPILVLHNADEAGLALVEQMRAWLPDRQGDGGRIVDVGLSTDDERRRLTQMMPAELEQWLLGRLAELGIPAKLLPTDADIKRGIREQFERLLRGHLWEGMQQQLEIARLLDALDVESQFTRAMIDEALDQQLKQRLSRESRARSYAMVLDEIVGEFFARCMGQHGTTIRERVQTHLAAVRKEGRQ